MEFLLRAIAAWNIRDKKKRELSQDLDNPCKISNLQRRRSVRIVHFRKVSEESKGKRKSSRGSTEASLIQINRPRFARGRFLRLDREGSKRRRWRRWLAIRDTQEKKNLLPFSLPLPYSFRAINFRFRVSERGGRRHRWPSSRYSKIGEKKRKKKISTRGSRKIRGSI